MSTPSGRISNELERERERKKKEKKMPFIVATYVYASSQGQRTHSARTNNMLWEAWLRMPGSGCLAQDAWLIAKGINSNIFLFFLEFKYFVSKRSKCKFWDTTKIRSWRVHIRPRIKKKKEKYNFFAGTDRGPPSQVYARLTLRSALHRHKRKKIACSTTLNMGQPHHYQNYRCG